MKYSASSFGDFRCAHCRNIVPAAHIVSGVNNRNHCPYCLWSYHLDLFVAGDRLSACKGQMKPVGLTMKKGRNKYRLSAGGELMLIHQCVECGTLSINRIAADDHPDSVMEIFHESRLLSRQIRAECESQEILVLEEEESVTLQLYGERVELPAFEWN
jgi:hypothetical protein